MPYESLSTQPKSAGSFASLLASFTDSARKSTDQWDDAALADDVATISYDQSLRAHRRGHAQESLTVYEVAEVPEPAPSGSGKQRKTASITIRLAKEEEAQLRKRATAAQLSVSAYLRSCIFEAESLRSQVREALVQMNAASSQARAANSPDKSIRNWRKRFFSRLSHSDDPESRKSVASS